MRFLRLVILFLLVVVACTSCNLAKRCAQLYPPMGDTVIFKYDSIVTVEKIIERKIPVTVPAETITIKDTIPCPDIDYNKSAKNGAISADIKISKGQLEVNCKTDSLFQVILLLKDTLSEVRRYSGLNQTFNQTRTVPVPVPTPYIPKWMYWVVGITMVYWIWRLWPVGSKLITKLKSLWK